VHKNKNGKEIIVDLRAHNILYKGKEAKVVLATDITERYKHIKAIEAQNEKLKQIAWTQSHEVRAPLTNIMGLIDVLSSVTLSADEKEEFSKYLMASANELDSVIKNIVKTTEQVLVTK
jgi:K+-sensing histidine kinase KdpD